MNLTGAKTALSLIWNKGLPLAPQTSPFSWFKTESQEGQKAVLKCMVGGSWQDKIRAGQLKKTSFRQGGKMGEGEKRDFTQLLGEGGKSLKQVASFIDKSVGRLN